MVRGILAIILLLMLGGEAFAEAGRAPQITSPSSAELDFDTAYAAQSRDDPDQAILFYDRVIRAGGMSAWSTAIALSDRGFAYLDKNRIDRAVADFEAAMKVEPDYAPAFVGRGLAYYWQDKPDLAVADFDEAIRLDPEDEFAYRHRGLVFYYKRNYKRALADAEMAVKLKPEHAAAYFDRGRAHYQLDQDDKALADFSEAIRLRGDFAE